MLAEPRMPPKQAARSSQRTASHAHGTGFELVYKTISAAVAEILELVALVGGVVGMVACEFNQRQGFPRGPWAAGRAHFMGIAALAQQKARRHARSAKQIGTIAARFCERLYFAPFSYLRVVAADQYFGHRPTTEVRGPCVVREIQ